MVFAGIGFEIKSKYERHAVNDKNADRNKDRGLHHV